MNNEEKILEILEKLTEEVSRHGEMLAKQGETLAKQGEMLAKHDVILNKLVEKVDRQGERLEEIDDRSLRSAVILENEVLPRLQLLYEGQANLRETLAPKAQVEILRDDVETLKSTVKIMTKRLDTLEKAQ